MPSFSLNKTHIDNTGLENEKLIKNKRAIVGQSHTNMGRKSVHWSWECKQRKQDKNYNMVDLLQMKFDSLEVLSIDFVLENPALLVTTLPSGNPFYMSHLTATGCSD